MICSASGDSLTSRSRMRAGRSLFCSFRISEAIVGRSKRHGPECPNPKAVYRRLYNCSIQLLGTHAAVAVGAQCRPTFLPAGSTQSYWPNYTEQL